MPLYLYSCHTCELELEELHPLGQAPEQSIRCPLCGGDFVRDLGRFQVGGRHPVPSNNAPTHVIAHGSDCRCCTPRAARR